MVDKCLFVVVVYAGLVTWSAGYHLASPPLSGKAGSNRGHEAAIIIIPEVGMSCNDYDRLARMIQQEYPIRLWVSQLDTANVETLTLDNLPLLLGESIAGMTELGLTKEADVFLAAHGLTGHVVAAYCQAVPSSLRGLILFGACLSKRFDSFPLPVLTIVGEADGIVRITKIAQAFQSMMSDPSLEPATIIQSPIVLLKGANHESFATGSLPLALHALDINPHVEKIVIMRKASNLTAIFIAGILQEPNDSVQIAQQVFQAAFEHARTLTQPIRSLMEMTQNNRKSYWVKAAQKWLSGLEGKHSTQLEVDSYVVADQVPLPPALVKEHGISYVITFSDIIRGAESDGKDDALNPQAPLEIAARMVGPQRIQHYLDNTTITHNYTCRDLNYASFMTAYHTASDRARDLYDVYHRGVLFEPDIVTDSEALWESTRLKLEIVSGVLHVTSISYKTANDELLGQYAGLFFCKLLPPDRALEWIYVDSLRRTVSYPGEHKNTPEEH